MIDSKLFLEKLDKEIIKAYQDKAKYDKRFEKAQNGELEENEFYDLLERREFLEGYAIGLDNAKAWFQGLDKESLK